MLGLIGWSRCTSDTWTLREFVTFVSAASGYSIELGGPWVPAPGDIITDANGVADTVTSVPAATTVQPFHTVNSPSGPTWADGLTTVTRARDIVPPAVVNFQGTATAVDDPSGQRTNVTLSGGNTIVDSAFPSNQQPYVPTGWAHASTVIVNADSDLLEIRSAHWHSPQGIKLLINGHATNRFVVKHNDASLAQNTIITMDGSDIVVDPGDSVAFIRDTQGSNDRWRAGRNNVSTIANVLGDTMILDYDARAANWTPGTPPAVASAVNVADPGDYDIANGIGSRPDGVTRALGEAWEFNPSESLIVENVTAKALDPGDNVTVFAVASMAAGGSQSVIETSDTAATANRGIVLFATGGLLKARAFTASAGLQTASVTQPADALDHVLVASCEAGGITVSVDDDTPVTTSITTGGLSVEQDCVYLGSLASSVFHLNGDVFRVIVAKNPTTDQINRVRSLLIANGPTA